MDCLTIREYDRLYVREKRDLAHNIISIEDAHDLESIVINDSPIFGFAPGYIYAQQWVGVIFTNGFSLEILPKIYGYVDAENLRRILNRMILASGMMPSIKNINASIAIQSNSIADIIIQKYLALLEQYVKTGMHHAYQKTVRNSDVLKGKILFNKQIQKNPVALTKFICRYSKYMVDNPLNQFFKACLSAMKNAVTNPALLNQIKYLEVFFSDISVISKDHAMSQRIVFDPTNAYAKDAYLLGMLFLQNLFASMATGNLNVLSFLFDMNKLYEMFVFRVARLVYGSHVIYQQRGNYLLSSTIDHKRYVALRPDLVLEKSPSDRWVIDTKWKIPKTFAKESDVYQMNSYSSSIPLTSKVILLYPHVFETERITGNYKFLSNDGSNRDLIIKTVDLGKCLDWSNFLLYFRSLFSD